MRCHYTGTRKSVSQLASTPVAIKRLGRVKQGGRHDITQVHIVNNILAMFTPERRGALELRQTGLPKTVNLFIRSDQAGEEGLSQQMSTGTLF